MPTIEERVAALEAFAQALAASGADREPDGVLQGAINHLAAERRAARKARDFGTETTLSLAIAFFDNTALEAHAKD